MKLLIFLGILLSYMAQGQNSTYRGFPSLVWPSLYDVEYKESDKSSEFDKPVFSAKTRALEGKSVILPGFMVPFDNGLRSKEFMLSSLPLNACFFCGVGGPETVVQVIAKETTKYTDRPVEMKGILRLNDSDPEKMIYILDQAELLGELEF